MLVGQHTLQTHLQHSLLDNREANDRSLRQVLQVACLLSGYHNRSGRTYCDGKTNSVQNANHTGCSIASDHQPAERLLSEMLSRYDSDQQQLLHLGNHASACAVVQALHPGTDLEGFSGFELWWARWSVG